MTSLSPLLDAGPAIQLHVAGAVTALLLGPVALYRKRRDRLHKILGYTWILAMTLTAISSFWIHSLRLIGPFGPIHLLSIWALISLAQGLSAAIRGQIARHQATMRSLYLYAIGAAGIFTLLPGRIVPRMLFGDDSQMGLWLIAGLVALGLAGMARGRLRKSPRNA